MTRLASIDGLPVIDAKKPLELHIIMDDIRKADRKHPDACAVANACYREIHATEARVHLGRVYVKTTADKWVRYITPKSLRQEIITFDRGGVFEPGTYVLHKPQPSHQLGKQKPGRIAGKKVGAKKRRSPHVVTNVRSGPAAS